MSLDTGIYTKNYLVPSRLSLYKIQNIGAQKHKLFWIHIVLKGHNKWTAMGSEICFIHVPKGKQSWAFFFYMWYTNRMNWQN